MTWDDAFAPAEARYKSEVMAATWGHLAPRQRKTYRGYILFAIPAYDSGTPCIIEAEFKGLADSPWLYDAMWDFACSVERGDEGEGAGVYRFDGTFRNYEFNGEIKRLLSRG